jgi:hypothetical protein
MTLHRLAATIVVFCCAAALLAACGGPSGGQPSSPTAATAASVNPTPLRTYISGSLPAEARAVLKQYFAAVGRGDGDAAAALLTPSSPLHDRPTMGITSISGVVINDKPLFDPPSGASAMAMVSAHVEAETDTAWGPPTTHDFFMSVTRMPDGSWLVYSMATGP